jgi:hypothetical protein
VWQQRRTMRISATDVESVTAAATLLEATRRLAHQASNAANAAAVNVEVLRSRLARGAEGTESLTAFAERAAAATEQVTGSVMTIRAVLAALVDAAAGGERGSVRPVPGDPDAVEVRGSTSVALDAAAHRFAEAAGVTLSLSSTGIILKVLRQGAAYNDATE